VTFTARIIAESGRTTIDHHLNLQGIILPQRSLPIHYYLKLKLIYFPSIQSDMSAFNSSLRPFLRASSGAALSTRSFSTSSPRSIARMIITGRLAAEPELHATSTGQDVIKYAVGTSYGKGDNRQTSWFRVSSFQPEGSQRDFILGLPKG
jgi:hypothetical protein